MSLCTYVRLMIEGFNIYIHRYTPDNSVIAMKGQLQVPIHVMDRGVHYKYLVHTELTTAGVSKEMEPFEHLHSSCFDYRYLRNKSCKPPGETNVCIVRKIFIFVVCFCRPIPQI